MHLRTILSNIICNNTVLIVTNSNKQPYLFRKKLTPRKEETCAGCNPLCPVSASDLYVYFCDLTNNYAESNRHFYFIFDTKTNFKPTIANLTYFVFFGNGKYEIDNIKPENKPDGIV